MNEDLIKKIYLIFLILKKPINKIVVRLEGRNKNINFNTARILPLLSNQTIDSINNGRLSKGITYMTINNYLESLWVK